MAPFDPWQSAVAAAEVLAGNWSSPRTLKWLAHARWRSLLNAAQRAPLQARYLREACGLRQHPGMAPTIPSERLDTLSLQAVPPMDRQQWQAHLEESWTDTDIRRPALDAFLADPARLGDGLLDRYAVWTSSGSSGIPAISLHDTRALAIYDALECLRFALPARPFSAAYSSGLRHRHPVPPFLAMPGAPRLAMLAATGGHFAGIASIRRCLRITPALSDRLRIFSILQPLRDLVNDLNAFNPTVVATYPTAAESLAEEQASGRLTLSLQAMWLGGEQLSPSLAAHLARSFDCDIRQSYGASECLSIGWSCELGRLHLNSDWVVLEPVDASGRLVEPGQASHTVLLTNLANHVQPIIRYDLGDSVTWLTDACLCGSAFPAIEVDGRRDDVIEFISHQGPVRLLPLALSTVLEEDAGCHDFQLIATGPDTLALRLGSAESADPGRRDQCHRALSNYLSRMGLPQVRITDDPAPPRRDARSGKLRRILKSRAA